MDDANIIAEIEEIIRTVPDVHHPWRAKEHYEWLDRVKEVLEHSEVGKGKEARVLIAQALSSRASSTSRAQILIMLKGALQRLR